jgi:hypothetical protein
MVQMNIRKITLLSLALVLSAGFATSSIITNSQDWKDTSIAVSYSGFTGDDAYSVTDYSEALVVSGLLGSNGSHTVFESENPVWEGYETKLSNEDVNNVETRPLEWEESQFDLYSDVSDQVEGFIVVQPDYGMNTISAFSKVIRDDYWLLYYNGQETERFLENQGKPVTYYGDFLRRPWDSTDLQNETIISEGSMQENNAELVRRQLRSGDSSSMVYAQDSFFEPRFLKKGDPILVDQSLDTASSIVQENEVDVVQVIGASQVNFGSDLEDRAENTSVIAKFGRRFTGVNELRDTYPIKKVDVRPVETDISVSGVRFNPGSTGLEVVFDNAGTLPTRVNLSAISLSGQGNSDVVSTSRSVLTRPEKNTTVEIDSNLTFTPETASISFTYPGGESLGNNQFGVEQVNSTSVSDLSLEDVFYMKPDREIVMEIRNTGDNVVTTGTYLDDLSIMNRTVDVLSESQTAISPGSSRQLRVDAYLTEEEIERNQNLQVVAAYGPSRLTALDLERFESSSLEVRENTLRDVATTYVVPGVIVIVIILLVLLYRKRRKQNENLRGLQ